MREQRESKGEYEGAEEEEMNETVDSAGAKRRWMSQQTITGCPKFLSARIRQAEWNVRGTEYERMTFLK